jgi:SNF2 family DNA or RNA helicase
MKPPKIISRTAGEIWVEVDYLVKDKLKTTIPNCRWDGNLKLWHFPDEYEQQFKDLFNLGGKSMEMESTVVEGEILPEVENHTYIIKPMAHQKEDICSMIKHEQYGLFCEMGTGKTKTVIDFYAIMRRIRIQSTDNHLKCCFVVCPSTVMYGWKEEIEKNSSFTCNILSGTPKQRIKLIEEDADFYIINYEGLLPIKDILPVFNDPDVVVVLDESSKIKSWKAKRTKLILKVFVDNIYKFILSGTPITQSPIDIFTQFEFLNRSFIENKTIYSFRNTYCECIQRDTYVQIIGYKNLDKLKEIINAHSTIRKKKDCIDLPPKIYEVRTLQMSYDLRVQYNEMNTNLMIEFKNMGSEGNLTAQIMLTKLLRLQQITSGAYLTDQKSNAKLVELCSVLKEGMHNDTKVIVWTRFVESMALLKKKLNGEGYRVESIDGKTPIKTRADIISKFNESPDSMVLLIQIKIGSMGLNLQGGTLVIYYENSFSLEERLQSEDRCHRMGQTNKVTYVDIIYDRCIDTRILSAIKSKKKVSDYLVGGVREEMENNNEY